MFKVDIGLYLPGTQEVLQSISPSEVKAEWRWKPFVCCKVVYEQPWASLGSWWYILVSIFCSLLQKYPEHAIRKVLQLMLRRGEVQHRMQRKVLYRLKWAHCPSNLNASTAPPLLKPECQLRSTSQLVFAILRKRFCLTASDCCLQMHWFWKCALVSWSHHCVQVYEFRCRCLSPVLPPQRDRSGARRGSVVRQVCTLAPGLPDCQASCTQRK